MVISCRYYGCSNRHSNYKQKNSKKKKNIENVGESSGPTIKPPETIESNGSSTCSAPEIENIIENSLKNNNPSPNKKKQNIGESSRYT